MIYSYKGCLGLKRNNQSLPKKEKKEKIINGVGMGKGGGGLFSSAEGNMYVHIHINYCITNCSLETNRYSFLEHAV